MCIDSVLLQKTDRKCNSKYWVVRNVHAKSLRTVNALTRLVNLTVRVKGAR